MTSQVTFPNPGKLLKPLEQRGVRFGESVDGWWPATLPKNWVIVKVSETKKETKIVILDAARTPQAWMIRKRSRILGEKWSLHSFDHVYLGFNPLKIKPIDEVFYRPI